MREEEEEEKGTKNVQGSLPKREAPINLQQQRHLVPSINNNFYESQREFPHNYSTQFSLFCPKKGS